MPSSPAFASINISEYAAKEEASYGAGGTVAVGDGIELWLENKIPALGTVGYLQDGDMGTQLAGLGEAPEVPPAGVFIKAPLPFFFRGPGVPYSGSVKAPLHSALKACGYDATGSFGVGTEKYDYTLTPEGSAITSLVDLLMHRGEEWKRDGVIGSLKIETSTSKPPKITIDTVGRRNADPVARALGAITYPYQTIAIPLGAPAAIVIGSFATAVVKTWMFDQGRSFENPRPDLNLSGYHAGYHPGVRKPRLTVNIEQTSLVASPFHTSSGINPQKLREAATKIAVTCQIGTAQYNRLKGSFPNCQLIAYDMVDVNGLACLQLTLKPVPSTPTASGDHTWTTD